VTVIAGLLLFDPQRPPSAEAGGETETLEGRVTQVLAEERSQAEEGGETGFIQTLLVEITRGAGHVLETDFPALDKFDALTNSLTEGLPREIELRQKQYEYYRNKLLTFKELDAA
jgi:hypothetical protein